MDLTIVIPAVNEAGNIQRVITDTESAARRLHISFEILVIDGGSEDGTPQLASSCGDFVRVVPQKKPGYGGAIREGLEQATGEYILTMDADLSHDPSFLSSFWNSRLDSEVIIGSRYIRGGEAHMPLFRKILSRWLNLFFRRGLSMPWYDLSSGYRMYHATSVKPLQLNSTNFEILQEILIRAYTKGYRVREIPIKYRPRGSGTSHARLFRFGIAYTRTFWAMWKLRNSIQSADYDDRAYDSVIPLQRYWQRKRCSILHQFAFKEGLTLDIGCGSSRILSYDFHPVGLDIQINKLRYARKFHRPLINASIWQLPFRDQVFDCVICSEVIEHIPAGIQPFLEMRRVLKPNGTLVIGTPDYAHATWRMIEYAYRLAAPGGYADEHITHYSLESLTKLLEDLGFRVLKNQYIVHSEMILQCVREKPTDHHGL